MRLDKFLTQVGVGTRSEVKKYIGKGRVTLNGEICKAPEQHISDKDVVCFDGNMLNVSQEKRYFMFHKPAGCVSAKVDANDETVMDFFSGENRSQDLCIVGRLDKDTEGLLIVTDDGAYCHELISPKKHIPKQYYFETDEKLIEDAVKICEQGMELKDGTKCSSSILEMIDDSKGMLTIYEGAYHQVKRMVAALGGHVTYLKRLSIGELCLDETLAKGTYRLMTEEEKCLAICQLPKKN